MILNKYEYSKITNDKLPTSWQSQRALDDLYYFLQQNWNQRYALYNDEEIKRQQQFLDFVGQGGIRTKKYIGTIVFKGEQLNIFPKVFKTDREDFDTDDLSQKHLLLNLVHWIEYCNKLDYPFLNISSELSDSENLKELFIKLYINYVRSALERGAYYRYIEVEDNLATIKGKFDFKDYIVKKIPNGDTAHFNCRYSAFEYDNPINRIIKYTCKQLYNITSKKNQKNLRKIFSRLNDVSDVYCTPSDCDGIRLSGMHKNYRIIISMSKMFLLNKVSTYSIDANEAFCFLFPTDLLFEGFVGGYLKDTLSNYEAKVTLQESNANLIDKIVYKGITTGAAFNMRHDILVEYNGKVFILDTKYKELTRFEDNPDYAEDIEDEINQGDMNQVLEYARKRGLSDVYLLYPMYRYEEKENEFPVAVSGSSSGDINVHFIRLPFVYEDNVDIEDSLTSTIKAIFDIK